MPKSNSELIHNLHVWMSKWYPIVALVLFAIILGGGYFKFLKPMISNVVSLQNDQLKVLLANKDAVAYGKELENFIEKSNKFSQENAESLKRLTNFMPEKPTIPQLFTLFEYFFKENGFTVNKLDFNIRDSFESESLELGEVDDGNGNKVKVILPPLDKSVGVVDVSASVSGGGYVELKNMLNKMEKIGRLVDLNNLNIEAKEGEGSTDYNLQMRTYFYKDNQ